MKWIKVSDREQHVAAGGFIFSAMLLLCIVISLRDFRGVIVSDAATLIAAIVADYKDKLWGGLFDWLDVLATMFMPIIMTVVLGLMFVFLR